MTTKTANVNGKRRARHFSGPSVTLPRLSPFAFLSRVYHSGETIQFVSKKTSEP